ncbi:MAG TPA: peptidoglycan DD-metalloendopeptidase family protein [Bacillota bacterium]|nr:peptidoglycan DD-metalloendopeptidase family protein [Bacillota bacterium]HOL09047.1 peptidoglycan DD-metalloendopeptidase family protein [Bacillota bacterium]HPO96722.1 peptidoglycan DD-metalloendopeptidase family protein [Bacillota bacterium]
MRLKTVLLLLGIVVFSTTLFSPGLVYGAGSQQNLDTIINKTKQELNREKVKERSVITNLQKQQKELTKLENNYTRIKTNLSKSQHKLSLTKQELTALKDDLSVLEEELDAKKESLGEFLTVVYMYGPQSYLEVLLQAENFGDFITRFNNLAYFVRKDFELINQYVELRRELVKKQTTIKKKQELAEKEYQNIVSLQQTVLEEQQKIVRSVQATQNELAKIQNNRAKLEQALKEYEQTSNQIGEYIKKGQQVKILGTGVLVWPARGRITSNFGWRKHPVLKKQKYHNGIDIAVPKGTPVLAVDNGVVLVSGWQGGYGYFVAIDHGGGISTCFGHNSRLLVKAGDVVFKGQQIALSGSTGLSTGPHLHFEVRKNGVPVNPLLYLP